MWSKRRELHTVVVYVERMSAFILQRVEVLEDATWNADMNAHSNFVKLN